MKQDLQLPVLLKPAPYQSLKGSARAFLRMQEYGLEEFQLESAMIQQQKRLAEHINDLCDCE